MRHWWFADRVMMGYVAVVGMLILLGERAGVAHWGWLLVGHGLVLGLVPLLIRQAAVKGASSWRVGLRHFYALLLFPFCYRESQHLNQLFLTGYLDPAVIRLEEAVFGCQPGVRFMAALPWPMVSEVLHAAYFSFYLMVAGMAVCLFVTDRARMAHYLSVTATVFCGCYLSFIFLPVIGPRLFLGPVSGYALPEELMPAEAVGTPEGVSRGWLFRLMSFIYEHGEGAGGAMPSSHVAVAVCTVLFSYRYGWRIRHGHLAVVVLLCLSTVYGRYHYAVDVLGGWLAAAVLIPVGEWGHRRWGSARRRRD